MNNLTPLLSVTIPTWNRGDFLKLNLEQLVSQLPELSYPIEILVSDNASTDDTQAVVAAFLNRGLPVCYIRNPENIGSDHNIAQCFNLAKGQYVLILGDDDLLIDGALKRLEQLLSQKSYGAVAFRAYGYDYNFKTERPIDSERLYEFSDVNDYLIRLGVKSTLISCNIIGKSYLPDCDAVSFCGSNLVQTDLVISAALRAENNLYIDSYLVACKRNNSGGYSFFDVFVNKYFYILEKYRTEGVSIKAIKAIERRMLIGFYPYYAWKHRLSNDRNLMQSYSILDNRFGNSWQFYAFIWPIFKLPKFIAIGWGSILVALGRIVIGDLRRGLQFLLSKIFIKSTS